MPYVEYDEVEAVCRDCGRAFRTEEDLEEHRQESHSTTVKAAPEPGSSRNVKCSLCRERFHSTAALQEHTRRAHSS